MFCAKLYILSAKAICRKAKVWSKYITVIKSLWNNRRYTEINTTETMVFANMFTYTD